MSELTIIPKFSVIIPLFNKERYISRAINSVLLQDFQNFEIIVVDDGSSDESYSVVKSFNDCRITVIQQENSGAAAARNTGISIAKGSIITFLDADDEYLPHFLSEISHLIEKFPDTGIITTDCIISDTKSTYRLRRRGIPLSPWAGKIVNYFRAATLSDAIVLSSCVAIPRHVFSKVGLFNADFWWGEDTDLWGRIALQYPVVFTWFCGAIYHRDALNRVCNRSIVVQKHPFVLTLEHELEKNGFIITRDIENYLEKLNFETMYHNFINGDIHLARMIHLQMNHIRRFRFCYILARILFLLPKPQIVRFRPIIDFLWYHGITYLP